jgi:uncharacterized membrane protein YhaH (DUF805 family)
MNWILVPFRRMSDVSGRSRRLEFWLFWLAAMVLQMVAAYFDAAGAQPFVVGGMGVVTLVVTLIFLVPATTVGIRRLHDIDRSGWWMLLLGLPYLGWLISVHAGSQDVIPALALLLGAVILLVLLVQPGTAGDNRYGPNPKAGIADHKSAD